MTDWRYFARDTGTNTLHVNIQSGVGIHSNTRSINNYDPDWMLQLKAEAERIMRHFKSLKINRDVELVFKIDPAYHNGWEYNVNGRAIRIEVFTHAKERAIKEDGSGFEVKNGLRDMLWLKYVLRHEFGHAFHDMCFHEVAELWKPRVREHFADAFAIWYGSEIDEVLKGHDIEAAKTLRYVENMKSISLVMQEYMTARLDWSEATTTLDRTRGEFDMLKAVGKLMNFKAKPKSVAKAAKNKR